MCSFVDFHIPSHNKISGTGVDFAGIDILPLQLIPDQVSQSGMVNIYV